MSQLLHTPSDLDPLHSESGESELVIIDVRLADEFDAGHLPNAIGNCVFEVAFGERLAETVPNKSTPIVVYGAEESSAESAMAAEKLDRAGYQNVYDFRGGMTAWLAEGREISSKKGAKNPVESKPEDGRYLLDLDESRVTWTGRNLINSHTGTVAIASGWLEIEGGLISSGEVQLDMNQMTCTDLEGTPVHDVLIEHLQSDDFFDTGHYPDARFVIVQSRKVSGPGAPNLRVKGGATIKGQTHPLQFEVSAGLTDEGMPAAQASLSIDRTKWGVIYGSGKFFKRLAGHLVNDEIDLELRILTKKE